MCADVAHHVCTNKVFLLRLLSSLQFETLSIKNIRPSWSQCARYLRQISDNHKLRMFCFGWPAHATHLKYKPPSAVMSVNAHTKINLAICLLFENQTAQRLVNYPGISNGSTSKGQLAINLGVWHQPSCKFTFSMLTFYQVQEARVPRNLAWTHNA